jgi:hypothetical protein
VSAKKNILGTFFGVLFTTASLSKKNHFGCFKLVNCLQFELLPASIVSRIAHICHIPEAPRSLHSTVGGMITFQFPVVQLVLMFVWIAMPKNCT